jgi:hypothetical protein
VLQLREDLLLSVNPLRLVLFQDMILVHNFNCIDCAGGYLLCLLDLGRRQKLPGKNDSIERGMENYKHEYLTHFYVKEEEMVFPVRIN